jgi:hypothetical protein
VVGGVAGLAAAPARAEQVGAEQVGAQDAGVTYALSLVRAAGAEGCPTGRALASDVERRLGRKVFDVTAERSFEVEVTRVGSRYRSDVYVRDAAGRAVGQRTLESDEAGCGALFDATALAVALVIDPEAANRSPGMHGVAAFDAPSAPAPPPAAPVLVPVPVPAPAPVVAPAAVVEPLRVPVAPTPALVVASLRGLLALGVVGQVSPGVGLGFSARPGRRWGVAVSGAYLAPRTARAGGGIFEIGLTRLTVAASFDVTPSDDFRLILSAGPSLGAFHVAAREPAPVTDPGDFVFAAIEFGPELQVAVSSTVFLVAGGQGLVPLRRQEFFARGESEPVWSQPWLSGLGFLGLGARFP